MVRQNILAGRIKEAFKSHLLNEEAILIEKEVVVGSLKIRVSKVSVSEAVISPILIFYLRGLKSLLGRR